VESEGQSNQFRANPAGKGMRGKVLVELADYCVTMVVEAILSGKAGSRFVKEGEPRVHFESGYQLIGRASAVQSCRDFGSNR
jgi:hypothetical protein